MESECRCKPVPAILAALLSLTAFRVLGSPQESGAPEVTLHAETRVVQIEVSARDSHGKPVRDLAKEDFTIIDNGKPRPIDIFRIEDGKTGDNACAPPAMPSLEPQPDTYSNRNSAPRCVSGHSTVILIDDTYSAVGRSVVMRDSVTGVMSKVRSDERIALYLIDARRGLLLLQDYTTDRELLLASFKTYYTQRRPDSVLPRSEQVRLSLQTLANHLALLPGRKSLFFLSRGFPPEEMRGTGQFGWGKTFATLNEANVRVNTIDTLGAEVGSICGPPVCGGSHASSFDLATMQQIAEATGGAAYFGRNDMENAIAGEIEASRLVYVLGFYLPENERDSKFHALKIQTNRPGVELFYRQGYYAGETEIPDSARDKNEDLESSLLNQADSSEIAITAHAGISRGEPRGAASIDVSLDPGALTLTERAGGWAGKVDELFIELNESGRMLAKASGTKEFEVPASSRAQFNAHGLDWVQSLPLAPGATKITIVVRDTKSGRTGSLSVPIN